MPADNAYAIVKKHTSDLSALLCKPQNSKLPGWYPQVIGALGEIAFQNHLDAQGVASRLAGHRVYGWDIETQSGDLIECKTSFTGRFKSTGGKVATHVAKVSMKRQGQTLRVMNITLRRHPDPGDGHDHGRPLQVAPYQIFP